MVAFVEVSDGGYWISPERKKMLSYSKANKYLGTLKIKIKEFTYGRF